MEALRVQTIAATAVETIPGEFIRPENERPGSTTYTGTNAPDIPIIDLSESDNGQLVQKMAAAAKDWGIFHLVNHGIPEALIKQLQSVGKEFFERPQEEKDGYSADPKSESMEGYGNNMFKQQDGKRTWSDYFFHVIWPPSHVNLDIWPEKPAAYRETNEEYARHMVALVEKIMEALSQGLGLEKNAIKLAAGDGQDLEYRILINYYPPCPRPDLALGVEPHTDLSVVTVLVPNDVPGLQVSKDGLWIQANHVPNSLIVNTGDVMEVISNGKYKAVMHRAAVNIEKVRMSWPVFSAPFPDAVIGPMAQLLDEHNPPRFKTKEFKDYRYCKVNNLPQ